MADTRGEPFGGELRAELLVESNCPFCNIKQFEERLIAEVDGFYVIATLGQITGGGYVLLFPKEHISCMGALHKKQAIKSLLLSEKICSALTREFNLVISFKRFPSFPITIFEHGIVGQTIKHAHLHFLPVVLNLTPRIENDFPESRIELLSSAADLRGHYGKKQKPYLFWKNEGVDDWPRVCWDPPAPSQYLRIITAEALGRPERANWRTMDPELDKRLWSATVRRLKPYWAT